MTESSFTFSAPSPVAPSLPPVAALLSRPGAWTQGAFARNSEGDPVNSLDPSASSWCLRGAVAKCYSFVGPDGYSAIQRVLDAMHGSGFITFNDKRGRTQAEVVALCIKANV